MLLPNRYMPGNRRVQNKPEEGFLGGKRKKKRSLDNDTDQSVFCFSVVG